MAGCPSRLTGTLDDLAHLAIFSVRDRPHGHPSASNGDTATKAAGSGHASPGGDGQRDARDDVGQRSIFRDQHLDPSGWPAWLQDTHASRGHPDRRCADCRPSEIEEQDKDGHHTQDQRPCIGSFFTGITLHRVLAFEPPRGPREPLSACYDDDHQYQARDGNRNGVSVHGSESAAVFLSGLLLQVASRLTERPKRERSDNCHCPEAEQNSHCRFVHSNRSPFSDNHGERRPLWSTHCADPKRQEALASLARTGPRSATFPPTAQHNCEPRPQSSHITSRGPPAGRPGQSTRRRRGRPPGVPVAGRLLGRRCAPQAWLACVGSGLRCASPAEHCEGQRGRHPKNRHEANPGRLCREGQDGHANSR